MEQSCQGLKSLTKGKQKVTTVNGASGTSGLSDIFSEHGS